MPKRGTQLMPFGYDQRAFVFQWQQDEFTAQENLLKGIHLSSESASEEISKIRIKQDLFMICDLPKHRSFL
jgi:hypothetical protein